MTICTQSMQRTWWPVASTTFVTGSYSAITHYLLPLGFVPVLPHKSFQSDLFLSDSLRRWIYCICFENHLMRQICVSMNFSFLRSLQQRNSSMKDAEEFPVAPCGCSNWLWSILSGEILSGRDFLYEQTVRISLFIFQTSFIYYLNNQWPILLKKSTIV